ncbi:NAD(P)H-binding protein (plasmid) [Ensifer adhaerens]|uniref:SDR family oxidoreductase n=1 Tax=Ensifer adhaerens TaxID=106592 RepID=UPI0023AA000D|nr:NAD(P)H-binding protein [Ensifer adhaerens]WDZ79338.1 NAD(P)H-binding protein [Ensifer adhaerens]
MRIAVIGASGFIGSRVTSELIARGHEVIAVSPTFGVDAVTGQGLRQSLEDVEAIVDVSNAGAFGDVNALHFFRAAGRNLVAAAVEAGVQRHIVLSVVGTDRLVENDYFRAKLVQENIARASPLSITVVRSTQFFEFLQSVTVMNPIDDDLLLPSTLIRPIAADDVVHFLIRSVEEGTGDSFVEIAGPEIWQLDDLGRMLLAADEDPRRIVSDPESRYFGVPIAHDSMLAC